MSNQGQKTDRDLPTLKCLASAEVLQGPMQALDYISKGRHPLVAADVDASKGCPPQREIRYLGDP